MADVITLHDEIIPENEYLIFDPENPWKNKVLTNYCVKELQCQIFKSGKLLYTVPSLKEIANFAKTNLDTFWDEVKRIQNPHKYYVDLSQKLWDLKNEMLNNYK